MRFELSIQNLEHVFLQPEWVTNQTLDVALVHEQLIPRSELLVDDLIAGVYALLITQGVARLLLPMSSLG